MLVSIPALNDNYIWLYGRADFPVIVIDIPETTQLIPYIQQNQLRVEAVLLTHHHDDHTAGVNEFKRVFPHIKVFGPEETSKKGATEIIQAGKLKTKNYDIQVIETAGHTEQHISYVVDGHLFCGDSLFSAGCGRVFTGDYEKMFTGLQCLKQLPDDTIVCPAHEYTLSNLAFAETVFVHNEILIMHKEKVKHLRANNQPSLPTTLALEKEINPFLRAKTLDEFITLRKAKDSF